MSNYIYAYNEIPSDLELNGATLTDYLELPEIHRILNNKYQIYIVYQLNGQNVEYLKKGNFVKAKWVDGSYQYFELSNPVKNLNSISILGRHIGFMLNRNFIEHSFTSSGTGQTIMDNLYSSLVFKQPFKFNSDISESHQFTAKEVKPLEAIIGSNSGNQNLVGVTNGELDFDNFEISLKKRIGSDNNYRIGFGHNLLSIEETIDEDGIANSLYLVGGTPENDYNEDKEPIVFKYLEIEGVTDETRRIVKRENSNIDNIEDLKKWGQSLFDKDKIHEPSVTHEVSMVDLSMTTEYRDLYSKLARLNFGDTAHVNVTKLNIRISERLVECVWYPTIFKYKSMVLGNDLSMYTYQVENKTQVMKQEISNNKELLIENVKNATAWITGNKGGHVIFRPEKAPEEILIMDHPDVEKAEKVWRWNLGGLGYSKKGVNGPYETAITQDGKIVADFIKAGVLNGVRIQAEDKSFLIDMFNGKIRFIDSKTDTEIGALSPVFGGGKLKGYSFIQVPGFEFNLSTQSSKGDGSHGNVLSIPSESTAENPLLYLYGKTNVKGQLLINGEPVYPGGQGGGNGSGNLGSREEYAKNMITDNFNADYEKLYSSYLRFGRIQAWGLANRRSFDELNEIIRGQGVSPVFFWAYESGEGYNSTLSFLNHFYINPMLSVQQECRRTAQWVKETSLQNGSLAWYDAMYPYYTSPPDKQAKGNAYMAETKPGMIARVMLQGTAAATWAMFDPAALSGSVNGKQDYGDPFKHQMAAISSWQRPQTYIKPMKNYVVTSEFGWREGPFGGGTEFHNAIDLANGGGSTVYASGGGVVVTAGPNYFDWYGNYVVIRHPDGLYTGYAHLSSVSVTVGQQVNQGQRIGLEGATGPVTGPHLHFQFMKSYQNGWPVGGDADFMNPRDKVKL